MHTKHFLKINDSWVWWHKYTIPAHRRRRQEDQEFKASLGNIVKTFSKKIHELSCHIRNSE
jgi:hypothetical protein